MASSRCASAADRERRRSSRGLRAEGSELRAEMTAVLFAAAIIAITHVTVIDTEKGVAIADVNVVIDGERITAVDKTPPPKGAQVVDGRGKFLMPGLWDMHTHLSDSRASALPVMAATGVTYARDAGNSVLAEIDLWRG